ncbi:MAG TPA: hypothetical protein VLE44_02005 [Candidatus Saccharimonadales bacterium]|nr:hypothetical protein [Candidatus Saccharimonadales bacterium]
MADTIIEKEGFKNLHGKTETHEHKTAETKGITEFQQLTADINVLSRLEREKEHLKQKFEEEKAEGKRIANITSMNLEKTEDEYQQELDKRSPRIKEYFNQEKRTMSPEQVKKIGYTIASFGIDTSTKPGETNPAKEKIKKAYEDRKTERTVIERLVDAINKFRYKGSFQVGKATTSFPEIKVTTPVPTRPEGPIAAAKRRTTLPGEDIKQ